MTNERTLRHPNGGALKIGTEVHVSADSFCDERSEIRGCSGVFSSSISNCVVSNSTVFNSALQSTVARSSTVADSACAGLRLLRATLHRATATDAGLESSSSVEPMTLIDVIAENCELYGEWRLEGIARIPTGIWYRPPRFLHITGENGVSVGLTESTEGHALMACWRKPITKWLKAGPRLGRLHGWSEEQIRAAKEFYEQLGDVPLDGVQP